MRKPTSWIWAAAACVCAGLAGADGALPLAPGGGDEKPAPKDKGKPADEDWLGKGKDATAFPELALPKVDENDPKRAEKYQAQFAKLCPRLTGAKELTIEATDDTLRKLLKARLHQGVQEMIRIREVIRTGNWNPTFMFRDLLECLKDMQAAVIELWGDQPKELIPWLEELVVMAKEFERFTLIRVQLGSDPPQRLNAATRHRLAVEAALVKAKKRA